MAESKPRLVDVPGVAEYLGDKESHIRRLIDARQIPFKRLGKKLIRFDLDEIDRWLEDSTVEAEGA